MRSTTEQSQENEVITANTRPINRQSALGPVSKPAPQGGSVKSHRSRRSRSNAGTSLLSALTSNILQQTIVTFWLHESEIYIHSGVALMESAMTSYVMQSEIVRVPTSAECLKVTNSNPNGLHGEQVQDLPPVALAATWPMAHPHSLPRRAQGRMTTPLTGTASLRQHLSIAFHLTVEVF